VRRGDSLTGISALYGQPEVNYRDLVAANPHKALRFHGMPRGASATFASLREGEDLRLPWFWFAGKNAGKRSLLPAGMVGDVQSDALEDAIKASFGATYAPPAEVAAIANMVSLLWKQDHPGHELPSGQKLESTIKPYVDNATLWWALYGKTMDPAVASSIPWSETPWAAWGKAIAQGLQPGFIDWADINDYLEQNASIGEGAPQGGVDFAHPVDWKGNIPGTATPWAKASFSILPKIRFDLLPLDKIDFSGIPQNKSKEATDWLRHKLSALLGQGESKPPINGGGGIQIDPDWLNHHLPKPNDPQPCPAGQVWSNGKCVASAPPQQQPPPTGSSVSTIVAVGGVAIGLIALYLASNRK
jgi:hypothetical protein